MTLEPSPDRDYLGRKEKLLSALVLNRKRNQLGAYVPNEKQREFHAQKFRERLLCAGNRLGKTYCASHEVAMHATGRYPDWWEGRRFDRPVLVWTGSESNETSKGIIQKMLLGTENPAKSDPAFGTGALPYDSIHRVTTRQAGVKNVVDEILVKHVSGGNSRIQTKTYEQGQAKWMGVAVDVVWLDEEPSYPIYSEAVTRTQSTNGIVLLTFTPLLGFTTVVQMFLEPQPGDIPRGVTVMTIDDVGHFTDEEKKTILMGYAPWERDTRAYGVPMAGEGRVFPVSEDEIRIDPFEIPSHFARIAGVDYGIDHPAAGAWLAWDRDADVVYLYDCYKQSGETPVYHAAAINRRGEWIPVVGPHDGINKEKGSGKALMDLYREAGVNMLPLTARYADDKGGAQDVEPSVLEILERMRTGRFKVFSHLNGFFDEFRTYHRKDGKIVPIRDDVLSATRYAVMMLRYARPHFLKPVRTVTPRGLRMAG